MDMSLDIGTITTIALAGLAVASTSGAVLWRIRAVEKKTDKLDVKFDELAKSVVGQARFEEHQREDDQRYQEIRDKFHDVNGTINAHGLDIAVLKIATGGKNQ